MVYTAIIPNELAEFTGISGQFQIVRLGYKAQADYYAGLRKQGYSDDENFIPVPYRAVAGYMFLQITVISVPYQLGSNIDEAIERMEPEMASWLLEEAYRINAPLEMKTSSVSATDTTTEEQSVSM